MEALTPRQAQVLEMIRSFAAEHGYPPTRYEIAEALGFSSVNAAVDHLKALARKGAIELLPGASRGIRVLRREGKGLPVIGRVAAGSPILAQEHIEGRYQLDPALFKPRAHYLLRVRGTSMRDAGILDGDLLAVHRTAEARNDQIVVARIEDEVTVKRFRRQRHAVSLLAANPKFAPIRIDLRRQELVIEGIGVGLIRNGKLL